MNKAKPILFCDFDGVLCHQRYWRSLPAEQYEKVQELLFRNDRTLVNDWMRGKYTAEEINKVVSEKIGMPSEELWDLFVKDCKTMNVDQDVLRDLYASRNHYVAILITGNTDAFSRFTVPSLSLDGYFDEISNSYYEGMHKKDNQGKLFLKYANKYGVAIEDCILFDDSLDVYKTFIELGGTPYLVTKEKGLAYHLEMLNTETD